jgi:uncharacterized protein involved in exopolysaccharide biosynthesis
MRISNKRSSRGAWLFPVVLAVCAATVAFAVASMLPKSYKSEATLYFPSPPDASGSLMSNIASTLRGGASLGGDKGGQVSLLNGALSSQLIAAGPQTAIAVMDSNLCRQRVIMKLGLTKLWKLPNHKARKRLGSTVAFGVDKNGLLAMEAAEEDPVLAKKILDAYIETLRQLGDELSLNMSKKNRVFVQERFEATRSQITLLEARLLRVAEGDPDQVMTASPGDAARGIVDLEKDRVRAQAFQSAADSSLRLATENARAVVKAGVNLPIHAELGRTLREKLAGLEYEFSLAKAELGPDNPRYRLLQNQVQSAREQVRREIGRENRALDIGIAPEIVKLSAEKASYDAQVDGLNRAIEAMKARLASVPARQMSKERISQELNGQRELLNWLAMELQKAEIAEQRDATTFQPIDSPEVPDEPFAPRRLFAAGMAGVAGLLVGIAFLVARASMRPDPLPLDMEREVAVV